MEQFISQNSYRCGACRTSHQIGVPCTRTHLVHTSIHRRDVLRWYMVGSFVTGMLVTLALNAI